MFAYVIRWIIIWLPSHFYLDVQFASESFKQGHELHFEKLPWLQCEGAQRHRNQWRGSRGGLGK